MIRYILFLLFIILCFWGCEEEQSKDCAGIVMKISGGSLNDPLKANNIKPKIKSFKEADLPF
jgi:hypothetical protein